MNKNTIKAASDAACRFLDRVRELETAQAEDKADMQKTGRRFSQDFPRYTGAVKRASMDLTRALADLRRPG